MAIPLSLIGGKKKNDSICSRNYDWGTNKEFRMRSDETLDEKWCKLIFYSQLEMIMDQNAKIYKTFKPDWLMIKEP